MTQNWRKQSREIREYLQAVVETRLQSRLIEGERRYPGEFQGDPLAHLAEEVYDIIYYHYYAERKMAYLDQYRRALEEWAGCPLTPEEARKRLGLGEA